MTKTRTFELPFVRASVRGPRQAVDWLAHAFADLPTLELAGPVRAEASVEISKTDTHWDVSGSDGLAARVATLGQAAWTTENHFERLMLARRGNRTAFHAGGVVSQGRVGLLAGRSESGKTTATMRLIDRGLALHCEELALVDTETDIVVPYARALSIRRPVRKLLKHPERSLVLDDHARYRAGRASREPTQLGSLALISYEDKTSPVLEKLSPSDAVVEVLGQCFEPSISAQCPEDLFDRVIALIERMPVYRLRYGSDEDAESTLVRWLETFSDGGP